MKMSQDLQISMSVAASEAANRGHEYLGLEHMLFALLHDDDTAGVLRHCGADIGRLKRSLERYLDQELERLSEGRRTIPQPTLGLQRVLSRAATHVQGSGKEEVLGRNVLVAIFAEPDSWAVDMLNKEGVTRLDVVSYLAHGVSRLDPDGEAQDLPIGDDEEGGPAADPLEAYTQDLTGMAAEGGVDPIIQRVKWAPRSVRDVVSSASSCSSGLPPMVDVWTYPRWVRSIRLSIMNM